MMRVTLHVAAPALILAACSQDAEAPVDSQVDPASVTDDETLMPDERSLADATGEGPTAQADGIPAGMQGRWGLLEADCTSKRGDAKGLIEISGDQIRYYESRGRLDNVASASDDSIRATYAMTGEGMNWTTDMELEMSDDGNTLVRREFGTDAMAEPLTYTRCD